MARRHGSGGDFLLILPWWAYLIAAAASYAFLTYLVPSLLGDANASSTATRAGPFVAGVFVLLGIGSVLRSIMIARRFEDQRRTNLQDRYHPHPQVEPTNWNRSNTTFGLSNDAPHCPICGKPMVLRAARRGAKAGSQFWGCSGHPDCQGTREV